MGEYQREVLAKTPGLYQVPNWSYGNFCEVCKFVTEEEKEEKEEKDKTHFYYFRSKAT